MALIATGAAACGTAQATPQGKVQNAFTKLGDQKSLTVGLSFDASADQIYAALKDEEDFTKGDAAMLAALHAGYEVSSDKPLSQLKSDDKSTSFGFQFATDPAAKKNLVEVRDVAGKLYLRADIKGIEKLSETVSDKGAAGSDDSDLKDLDAFLGSADKLPASLGAIKAALNGEWISVDPATFEGLAKTLGGSSATPSAVPSFDAASQAKLVAALKNALARDATFKDLGNHGGADHVQVTVPARQFAKDLKTGLVPALAKIPGFKASDLDDLDKVPNKKVAVDLAIKDGALSAITVDLAQFDDQAHAGKLPLVVTLDGKAATVSAPAGAKELKPQDLIGFFMSSMMPGTDDTATGSGTADPGSLDDLVKGMDLTQLPQS
ncbi:hypothetical protein [Streptomyces sp. NBC_01190]|uniref:hypothetical protein n=1 Tax=Streptomyces sp. NBC_01190 TaxID=2903767 RepID=UPI00386FA980|nr:hypothetical protein OG519_20515 [Streptomyces sp. NBC_01190]